MALILGAKPIGLVTLVSIKAIEATTIFNANLMKY